jgi:hypothetical protein
VQLGRDVAGRAEVRADFRAAPYLRACLKRTLASCRTLIGSFERNPLHANLFSACSTCRCYPTPHSTTDLAGHPHLTARTMWPQAAVLHVPLSRTAPCTTHRLALHCIEPSILSSWHPSHLVAAMTFISPSPPTAFFCYVPVLVLTLPFPSHSPTHRTIAMMYPPWLPWQEREFESHEPPLPRPPSDATHQEREAYVRTKVDRTKAKIKAEMSILELQCAYMDKAKTKKKLPPDVIAIATAEALDAIGSLHCSVETLKTQLAATKAKLKIAGLDVKNSPIVAQLKQDLNRETTLLKSARAAVKRWHLDPAVYKPLVPRNAADVAMFCETLPLAATDPHCVGLSINAFTVQRLLGYCVHVGKHTHAAAALEVYNRVRVTATAKMVPAIFQDLAGYGDVLEAAMSCPLEAKAVAQLTRLEGRVPQELNGKVLDMAAAAALVDPHPCNKRGRQRDHDVEYAVRQRMAATTGSIVIYDLVCAIVATALVPGTSPYVVPGGVKKLERMTFKTLTKYGADFSCCNDVVRCTVVTGSFAAMAVVVEAILGSEQRVVRHCLCFACVTSTLMVAFLLPRLPL